MSKRNRLTLKAVAPLLLGSMLLPATAQAKIPPIINTGNEIFEVADLPIISENLGPGWKLGYICDRFGLMWADAWTWNCQMTAVNLKEDSYYELPQELIDELSTEYSFSDAKRGVWNHYGMLMMIGGLGVMGMAKRRGA